MGQPDVDEQMRRRFATMTDPAYVGAVAEEIVGRERQCVWTAVCGVLCVDSDVCGVCVDSAPPASTACRCGVEMSALGFVFMRTSASHCRGASVVWKAERMFLEPDMKKNPFWSGIEGQARHLELEIDGEMERPSEKEKVNERETEEKMKRKWRGERERERERGEGRRRMGRQRRRSVGEKENVVSSLLFEIPS
ncbi:hypothetical protein P4O66_002503 [Electrophorus voltai]|uniref:Uncharacterized protein n=1 Tax=Electrophorus voltai TaxID=2609070 RepID=A0AAD8YWQ1_9TELE|nr:hypothetical protein P4O66_002503 [Electrophorus voltai]